LLSAGDCALEFARELYGRARQQAQVLAQRRDIGRLAERHRHGADNTLVQ
jgi:hypothetical protein